MFKAIVLLKADTISLSGRLKLKSYVLLGIYASAGNLHCSYNVTADPRETLHCDLQLFDVNLRRNITCQVGDC